MAPILKEADASLPTASSAPAPPHSKPASESSARPQPVALEIPVTVNGARTIDGSEKRVPFSESTQTVLVFPHGAVVRIATPLAAGQLVFLTNEKSKKEVVCQVVKSKSTGGAAAYVELQFTEASAGFWGLQVPGSSTVPSSPRPGPVPVAPKVVAPALAAPKPAAPSVPPVSEQAPVPSNVKPPAPPVAPSVAAVSPVIQDPIPVAPSASADIKSPIPSAPVPLAAHHPAQPPSPLHDYSKQIEALFAKPQPPIAPSVSDSHPTPAAPSTDELKQQAARLQEQLSSLLFTESHLAQPPSPTSKSQKPVIPSEPGLGSTERKSASPILAVDEEVKIPSWLAPLSQNAEATVASDSPEKSEVAHDASTVVTSEESHEALEASTNHAQAGVFGGQLLGESAAPAAEGVSSGSKKGLLIGIAATVLIAGGAWYFYQNRSASTPVTSAPATNAAPSSSPAPVTNSPGSSAPSMPAGKNEISSSAPASQPARKNTPSAASAAPLGEAEPRESRPALKTSEAVEEAPKPALGGVHLAAPVVSHSSKSQSDAPALPSIDTDSVSAAGDPLAAAAAPHDAPAAPLPVGGDVQQARLLKSVAPQYPAIAKAQRISGKVQIDALIDKSGNVANTKVISGPPLLYGAAVEAVKQWKYSPALLDGQPTFMHLTVTVEFRAQ
jgi:TonB family protein